MVFKEVNTILLYNPLLHSHSSSYGTLTQTCFKLWTPKELNRFTISSVISLSSSEFTLTYLALTLLCTQLMFSNYSSSAVWHSAYLSLISSKDEAIHWEFAICWSSEHLTLNYQHTASVADWAKQCVFFLDPSIDFFNWMYDVRLLNNNTASWSHSLHLHHCVQLANTGFFSVKSK